MGRHTVSPIHLPQLGFKTQQVVNKRLKLLKTLLVFLCIGFSGLLLSGLSITAAIAGPSSASAQSVSPASGPAGTTAVILFTAQDSDGITSIRSRMINPGTNGVVENNPTSRTAGDQFNGTWRTSFGMNPSYGTMTDGQSWRFEAEVTDALGNVSEWQSIGSFQITGENGRNDLTIFTLDYNCLLFAILLMVEFVEAQNCAN